MAIQATNLIQLLQNAGFKGDALRTAWALAMRESGGNPQAFNGNTGTGDQSYGLFQINMLGGMGPSRRAEYGLQSNNQLFNPATNARVAYQMSHGGQDFGAWGLGPNAYAGAPAAAKAAYYRYYNQFPGSAPVPIPQAAPAAGQAAAPGAAPAAAPPVRTPAMDGAALGAIVNYLTAA